MDLCHTPLYHDHSTIEASLWCDHCNNKHQQEIFCAMCGSGLFETSRLLSKMEGKIIWSHKSGTCDDPVPTLHDQRYTNLVANNEVGKIKHKVLTVLELEVEQINDYLDRPNPNVSEALISLGHIRQLMEDLQK